MLSQAAETLLGHAPPALKQQWYARIAWRLAMHPYQVQPEGVWQGWIMRAGRGAGKTQTGSFDVAESCLDNRNYRYGIVAPTLGDVRDTLYGSQSESGKP